MRYILIPVKDLDRAKQRLAALLTQEERTRLAWEMLHLTLAVASGVRNVDRTALITSYPPAIELAAAYGMEVIIETEQISESASVDLGSRLIEEKGAAAVLRLPIDLPLVTSADIERIFDCDAEGVSAVIVPSREGTGTNAILRRPPTIFPSHFGPNSLEKHLHEARQRGARCEVIELERIALDMDEPEDLTEFLRRKVDSPFRDLLLAMDIESRLRGRNGL